MKASKIANLTGISRIPINKILKSIRVLMSKECEKISKFSSEISKLTYKLRFEIDESYFGSKKARGLVLSFTLFATDKTHSL